MGGEVKSTTAKAGTPGSYSYTAPTTSPFYRHVLSPLCDVLCRTFVPKFVHPDVLTMLGIVAAGSATYCALNQYFIAAGLLWMSYSLLDSMDGKQARRTGKSSAGGEFLDHSCDSVTTTLSVIAWERVFIAGRGVNWQGHYSFWTGHGPYFFSTWVHAILGRLLLGTSVDSIDFLTVDEYNFIILPLLLFSRAAFPTMYDIHVPTLLAGVAAEQSGWMSQAAQTMSNLVDKFVVDVIVPEKEVTIGVVLVIILTLITAMPLIKLMIQFIRPSNLKSLMPGVIFYALTVYFNMSPWMTIGVFTQLIMEQIALRLKFGSLARCYAPLIVQVFLGMFLKQDHPYFMYVCLGYLAVTLWHMHLYKVFINNRALAQKQNK